MYGLEQIGHPRSLEELALEYWFVIHHPDWFVPVEGSDRIPINVLEQLRGVDKQQFFNAVELLGG
jgi:hypothetical protein